MRQDRAQINQWMDQAAIGNIDAFGKLALAVQDDMFRLVLAYGLNRADAAEATQEALLRAYRKRKKWQKGRDAMAWLYGIALNVVRETRRKMRRMPATAIDLATIPADGDCQRPGVAGELALLADSLSRLPDRQREAVACRFLRGLSVADAAKAMGCAEGTVKAAVFNHMPFHGAVDAAIGVEIKILFLERDAFTVKAIVNHNHKLARALI